jgi:hypothetical protein
LEPRQGLTHRFLYYIFDNFGEPAAAEIGGHRAVGAQVMEHDPPSHPPSPRLPSSFDYGVASSDVATAVVASLCRGAYENMAIPQARDRCYNIPLFLLS